MWPLTSFTLFKCRVSPLSQASPPFPQLHAWVLSTEIWRCCRELWEWESDSLMLSLSLKHTHTHKVHMNNNTHSHTHPETTLKGTSCKTQCISLSIIYVNIHVWLVIPDTAVAYVSRIPSEYCVDDITMGKDRALWAQLHREAAHLQTEFMYTSPQETHVNHSRPMNELSWKQMGTTPFINTWWGLFKLLFHSDMTSTAMLKLHATFCAMNQIPELLIKNTEEWCCHSLPGLQPGNQKVWGELQTYD